MRVRTNNGFIFMSRLKIKKRIPSVKEYNFIRSAAGLSKKDVRTAKKGLKNSLFSVCAYVGDELVGIGRVVGDGGVYFQIVDLAVLPGHQGKSIGSSIMTELMKYVSKNARSGSFISLFSNKNLAEYYKKFGFELRSSDSPGMSQMIKPIQ